MIQWILFAVSSLLLAVISWKSLHNRHSHGYHRFFAWEAILGLIVINAPIWFHDPFSWNQIISWILLVASLFPLVLGVNSLRSVGRPDPNVRSDPELLGIERTTNLVRIGIYKYIRHPSYLGQLLIILGSGIAFSNYVSIVILFIPFFLAVLYRISIEETVLMDYFTDAYLEYKKKTKLLIPWVY